DTIAILGFIDFHLIRLQNGRHKHLVSARGLHEYRAIFIVDSDAGLLPEHIFEILLSLPKCQRAHAGNSHRNDAPDALCCRHMTLLSYLAQCPHYCMERSMASSYTMAF